MKKFIRVHDIRFSNGKDAVVCNATLIDGTLNYESKVTISFSQLNMLLNQMSLANDGLDLYEYIESDATEDGEYFTLNFNQLEKTTVPLTLLQSLNSERKMRISA